MNNDLISRQAALEVTSRECHELRGVYADIEQAINGLPSVTSAKHGEWIRVAGGSLIDDYRCSCCDKKPPVKQIPEKKTWGWDFTDFCPNCGADMRGEPDGK